MKHQLDTSGLLCPLPILKAKKALKDLAEGEILQVISTDSSAVEDFSAFAKQTGYILLESYQEGEKYYFLLQK
ncbi:sulfurtransferase TusA [soil metagenome]